MDLGTRISLLLYGLLRSLLGLLPLYWGSAIGRTFGRVVGRFCPREQSLCRAQLDFVRSRNGFTRFRESPLAKVDAARFASDVFGHAGEAIAEAIQIHRILQQAVNPADVLRYVEVTGADLIYRLRDSCSGGVTLSAHLGCFDLQPAICKAFGLQVNIVARQANYRTIDLMNRQLKHSYGVETFWRDASTGKRIYAALKRGKVVAALIDQDTAMDSRFPLFFGAPAATPIGLVLLALRCRVPVGTCFIVRTAPFRHHMITEPIEHDPEDPDAAEHILRVYHDRLEALVAQYPEQWLWWHRRWRRAPGIDYDAEPEKLPSTADYLASLREATELGGVIPPTGKESACRG